MIVGQIYLPLMRMEIYINTSPDRAERDGSRREGSV